MKGFSEKKIEEIAESHKGDLTSVSQDFQDFENQIQKQIDKFKEQLRMYGQITSLVLAEKAKQKTPALKIKKIKQKTKQRRGPSIWVDRPLRVPAVSISSCGRKSSYLYFNSLFESEYHILQDGFKYVKVAVTEEVDSFVHDKKRYYFELTFLTSPMGICEKAAKIYRLRIPYPAGKTDKVGFRATVPTNMTKPGLFELCRKINKHWFPIKQLGKAKFNFIIKSD